MDNPQTYYVRPRIKKWPFCKPVIVFDLMLKYRAWDDPTYGNGGGEWVDACVRVATFNTEEEAFTFKAVMSKDYRGGSEE